MTLKGSQQFTEKQDARAMRRSVYYGLVIVIVCALLAHL
jgi:hypothetical protein